MNLTDPRTMSDQALLVSGPAAMAALMFKPATADADRGAAILLEIQRRGLAA